MNKNNQQLIKVFIAIVISAGTIGILTIFAGGIGEASGKLFIICYSLIAFGIFAAPCMVVAENPDYKLLGGAGMITAIAGFLITTISVLAGFGDGEMLKLLLVLFIASLALAQISFLFHINVQNKYARYARIAATTAISIFSFVIITQVFQPFPSLYMLGANQTILKLVGAAFIANLAATLLVPLCNRLHVEEPMELLQLTEEPPAQPNQTAE